MSFENFQLLDKEPSDNSIVKGDCLKIYYQHGAQLNQNNQNIEFIFAENNRYHQISNAYLELDKAVRNTACYCIADSNKRIINIVLPIVLLKLFWRRQEVVH